MPDRYAVMGDPVAHSKSPIIHAQFAKQTGESLVYEAIRVPAGELACAVSDFQAAGGMGLNITLPHKEEAFALAELRSSRAEQAAAVNTLWFANDGRCHGDNTDGVGLIRDLAQNHGISLASKRVLLLGAGGAARGVLGPLLGACRRGLVCANRTDSRAQELVAHFAKLGPVQVQSWLQLDGLEFDLIINATSASLKGKALALPEGILALGGACYDMVYGDEPTVFVRWGQAHGAAKSVDGLGMLVEQAAESFYRWRGVRPMTAPVIQALRDRRS
jgi:shikimate dehydrogenase